MFEREYEELARRQAEHTDEIIAMKFKRLELDMVNDLNSLLHGAFLDRLIRFNREKWNRSNLERFQKDINEIGYSISLDYMPDYFTTEIKGSMITSFVNPNKIKLTVTYKVISV